MIVPIQMLELMTLQHLSVNTELNYDYCANTNVEPMTLQHFSVDTELNYDYCANTSVKLKNNKKNWQKES